MEASALGRVLLCVSAKRYTRFPKGKRHRRACRVLLERSFGDPAKALNPAWPQPPGPGRSLFDGITGRAW
eukprot:40649-Eustigmatos_ZCMA.PRE.1